MVGLSLYSPAVKCLTFSGTLWHGLCPLALCRSSVRMDPLSPFSNPVNMMNTPHVGRGETRRVFIRKMVGSTALFVAGDSLFPMSASVQEPTASPSLPPSSGQKLEHIRLKINGQEVEVELDPRVTLLDLLREYLHLTGTKKGCDHGQCGACTVLVNGQRINSCLALAVCHDGDDLTTIEGLGTETELHPVQAAFLEEDGFQCGYCTPGQICSAVALIQEGHVHSDAEIREWMSGNICRCGAYKNIVAAIRAAAEKQAA